MNILDSNKETNIILFKRIILICMIYQALFVDKSPEMPVIKYEYICDLICVFFLFSVLVTRETFFLFLPNDFPFFYSSFTSLVLF
jgi:hypothetical protein